MSKEIAPLDPIRTKPFSYGSNGFTKSGCTRMEGSRIRELLFPEETKGVRAQRRIHEEARKTVKKAWMVAQLTHYGTVVSSRTNTEAIRRLLETSIVEDKCKNAPAAILKVENELRTKYDAANREHVAAETQKQAQAFSRLTSPSDEASYDIQLFLSKYFLDKHGRLDLSKSPKAMPLPGFRDRSTMHGAAEKILGVHTVSGRNCDDSRILVIGTDRNAVWQEASRINNQQARQLVDSTNAAWERKMQKHRGFVKQRGSALGSMIGQYIVKCEAISKNWSQQAQNLDLRISRRGDDDLVAIFDFGILEGIMRLGPDPRDLRDKETGRRGNMLRHAFDEDSEAQEETSDDENDDEENASEEADDDDDIGKPTRAVGTKHKATSQPVGQPPSKKTHARPTSVPRCYLQWRGRETGEGQIQLDHDNHNTGHLDFTDSTYSKFEGVASFDLVGEAVPFTGYKVSGIGGPVTRIWEEFSDKAYEYERVARWH